MPLELVDSIFIIEDPLASHPGTLIHDSFFRGPGICIELHDYANGNFHLEFCVLSFP